GAPGAGRADLGAAVDGDPLGDDRHAVGGSDDGHVGQVGRDPVLGPEVHDLVTAGPDAEAEGGRDRLGLVAHRHDGHVDLRPLVGGVEDDDLLGGDRLLGRQVRGLVLALAAGAVTALGRAVLPLLPLVAVLAAG